MNEKPHILIADDDLEDRFIMTQTFQELGHGDKIKFVEDGSLLMSYLDENGVGNLGLVVLDLNMPRLNGTETLRLLKNTPAYEHIPVIIFSTSVNEVERKICLKLGARDYITKPANYIDYVDTCEKLFSISMGLYE